MAYAEYDEIKRRHTGNGKGDALVPRTLKGAAIRALPDPDYIVKGVVDKGALAEFFGPPKCGKSFAALELALHIVAGTPWFGRRIHRCGVLYVSAEGGTGIKKRLEAATRRLGLDLDALNFGTVILPTNLLEHGDVEQLIVDAQDVDDIGLIIIDTASRVMPGGKEDTEAMSRLVAACDAIRTATGAAVLLIHHTGKDQSRGSRGGSVLPAAVDANVAFARDDQTRLHSAELVAARDGETGPIASFMLDVVTLGIDADGDASTTCVLVPSDLPKDVAQGRARPAQGDLAFEFLVDTMARYGQPAPAHAHIPTGTVVPITLWRDTCYERALALGTQHAKNAAFNRAVKRLQNNHRIAIWGDWVWIVQPSEPT
jgi:hypothetical protein